MGAFIKVEIIWVEVNVHIQTNWINANWCKNNDGEVIYRYYFCINEEGENRKHWRRRTTDPCRKNKWNKIKWRAHIAKNAMNQFILFWHCSTLMFTSIDSLQKHTIFVECFTELSTWIMIFINVKLLWGQQGFPLVESCDQESRSPIDQRAIKMEIKFGKDISLYRGPGGIELYYSMYLWTSNKWLIHMKFIFYERKNKQKLTFFCL